MNFNQRLKDFKHFKLSKPDGRRFKSNFSSMLHVTMDLMMYRSWAIVDRATILAWTLASIHKALINERAELWQHCKNFSFSIAGRSVGRFIDGERKVLATWTNVHSGRLPARASTQETRFRFKFGRKVGWRAIHKRSINRAPTTSETEANLCFSLFCRSKIRFFRLKTRLIFYWLASIPSAQQKAVDGEKCINSVRNSSLGRFISVWIRSSSAKAWNLNPVHSSPRFNCGKFLGRSNNGKYSNWRHRSFKIISKRGCWLVKARSLEIEVNMKNRGEICHMWCSSNLLSWANFSHRWSLKTI